MTDSDNKHRQAVALFRYGLIADLVRLPPGSPGLYARLREKARAEYAIPGTTRTRVAAETLRDWLKGYRQGGFDALLPKARTDRGRSRALPQAVADALLTLKEAGARAVHPPTAPGGTRTGYRAHLDGFAALHRASAAQLRRPDAQEARHAHRG